MKKFSKLITESSAERFAMHPSVDPEDRLKAQSLSDALNDERYTDKTRKKLKDLISCMNNDSVSYWQRNAKNKDSFEDFFKMFGIDSDEDAIKDCIRDLIDHTKDLHEDSDDNSGEFIIKMEGLLHKNIEDLKEDIKDAFSKLEMIDNADFYFLLEVPYSIKPVPLYERNMKLPKTLYDGRPTDIDAWFELNNEISTRGQKLDNLKPDNIVKISLHIYNPETRLENAWNNPF